MSNQNEEKIPASLVNIAVIFVVLVQVAVGLGIFYLQK